MNVLNWRRQIRGAFKIKKIFYCDNLLRLFRFSALCALLFQIIGLYYKKDLNIYLLFCLLFLIFGVLAIIFIIAVVIRSHVSNNYSNGGFLSNWYNDIMKIMGSDWLIDIYEKIVEHDYFKEKEVFNFISPSSNKAVYEFNLFEFLTCKNINCNFIVSDIDTIEGHIKSKTYSNSSFIYKERKDAKDIKNIIAENVDFILDFKGALWYSLGGISNKNFDAFKYILNEYYNALSDDGILVIDNIDCSRSKIVLVHLFRILIYSKYLYFGEKSTYYKLNKAFSKDKLLKNFVFSRFTPLVVTSNNNPKIRVLVLKKISS